MTSEPSLSLTSITTSNGLSRIPISVFEPGRAHRLRPGLLMFTDARGRAHAAGIDRERCIAISRAVGAVVVAVDVCEADGVARWLNVDFGYWLWSWMLDHSARLNVHARRLAVAGSGEGVTPAQAAVRLTHDANDIVPILEAAFYPGKPYGEPEPAYTTQAQLAAHTNATFLCIGENDRRCPRVMDYARRLREAGRSAEVHQLPGVGASLNRSEEHRQLSRNADAVLVGALARAVEAAAR